jgi:hypothetical protein
METTANPGEILLTASTYREVSRYVVCTPLGEVQVKGKSEPILAYSATAVIGGWQGYQVPSIKSTESTDRRLQELSLTETMVRPSFLAPESVQVDSDFLEALRSLFTELSLVGEELTRDYHEENAYLRYLQRKWDELVHAMGGSAPSGPSGPPSL